MNANITRHAYADYTGKPYIDSVGAPISVKPYSPSSKQAGHRTIIRNNQADALSPLPNGGCGCSTPKAVVPAHIGCPHNANCSCGPDCKCGPGCNCNAPTTFPKHAPVSAPKYAPVVASRPAVVRRPALTPRQVYTPNAVVKPTTAAAPPIGDHDKWAEKVRKDNLFATYSNAH